MTSVITRPGAVRLGTIAEAATTWATSKDTVRRRIADGTIRGYRIPGSRSIRVDLDEVERLVRPVPTVGGDAA